MSLDRKSVPPDGRKNRRHTGPHEPKKLGVRKRLQGKWHVHPVDKMVNIAHFLESTNPEFAAKIWIRLLDSCELEENKKKSFAMPPPAADTSASDEEAERALQEAEKNDEAAPQSNRESLDRGETGLQAETSPEENPQGDQGQQG